MKQLVYTAFFILLLGFFTHVQAQEFSRHKLKYGIGYGFSMSDKTTGAGSLISIGYEYDFGNDRFHISPNFVTGKFSSKYLLDAGDQYFNSMSLNTLLYYDLLKLKTFSLTIGVGALLNNTQGYLAASGWNSSSAAYINTWYFAGYAGAGFRINPKKGRLAFEIMPVNIQYMPYNGNLGAKYLTGIYSTVGISVRL